MRIVLLVPDVSGTSGWSRYALDLGRALAHHGHELHCAVAAKSKAVWCTEYPVLRQPTSYLNNPLLCLIHAWKVRRLLKRVKPDVVHVIAEPYALMLPLMGKQQWKTVLTIHGTYSVVPLTMGHMTKILAERYYKQVDAIISVSSFTKQYLSKRMPSLFAAANLDRTITVIHNAISLEGIEHDTTPRAADRTFSVLSVSGVKRKKGYLESIRAIRRFLDLHPVRLTYDIIGNNTIDPHFTRELLTEIAKQNLEHVVTLRGKLSEAELDATYRRADLFLLPSLQEDDYFEGFGLVFIEANARGTPVIGGDTGGCPEAIDESVSGYVCDPDDTDALAARMEDILLKNMIHRSDCVTWARKHDIKVIVEDIERIYA